MARNVELKAHAQNFDAQLELAAELSDTPAATIKQVDTFFKHEDGRLKLRQFSEQPAQLIYYRRPDQSGPKLSEYYLSETTSPETLLALLQQAHGVLATVNKTRRLFFSGRTRIHFDQVEGLGEFIELEVVLKEHETLKEGQQEAARLMDQLKIRSDSLIAQAYVDLIIKQGCERA